MKKGFLFGFGILLAGVALAAVVSVGDIPTKTADDFVTENEFNTIVDTLRGLYNDAGNIGIGKSAPTEALDVEGNIVASGTVCDSTGCIGGGGGEEQWAGTETGIYYSVGNVGIGTDVTDVNELTVAGTVGATKFCDETGTDCITIAELLQRLEEAGSSESPMSTEFAIMARTESCPAGIDEVELVIGERYADLANTGANRRMWDCTSGVTSGTADGCAVKYTDSWAHVENYNKLCLGSTETFGYIIVSPETTPSGYYNYTNNNVPSACPSGWTEYWAPAWTSGVDSTNKLYTFWDCHSELGVGPACGAARECGDTCRSITLSPRSRYIRYGKMCISPNEDLLKYLIIDRSASCPSGWNSSLAASTKIWDCNTSIQGCTQVNNTSSHNRNAYGKLCTR